MKNKIKISLIAFFVLAFVGGIAFVYSKNFRAEDDSHAEDSVVKQKENVRVQKDVNEYLKNKEEQKEFVCGKKYLGQDKDGWRAYREDEIGIQFKYPRELSIEEYSNNCIWQDNDISVFIVDKAKYDDRRMDEGILYEPWQFSSESFEELSEKPSCSKLSEIVKSFSYEDEYGSLLPSSFKESNICGVTQRGDNIIFYAIGVRDDMEKNPHIGGDIVVLKDDYFVVIEDVVNISNDKPQSVIDFELGKNKKNYTNEDQEALRDLYRKDALKRIEKSEKELVKSFDMLKKIGDSIEFDSDKYVSNKQLGPS
ncbi:MAG: hypothetical protein OEV93_02515 [Candidatus Moranbacteria bacterium]|nr:hypothetical protein [Candidatus Moranbacteria bacterium]